MTPTPKQVQRHLNELSARVNDAVEAYRSARNLASRPWELPTRVTQDLCDYHAAVIFKQRDASPDEARALTLDFLQRIEADGLCIEPLDPKRPAAGLRVVDPQLALLVSASEAEARRAAAERDAYAAEHATLLQEHEDQQRMAGIKSALAGDDPAAFRAALDQLPTGAPKTNRNTLTTHDMAGALK